MEELLLAMSSVQNASAPVNLESAGEREMMIHSLRLAVARSRLITNSLETIGVALRHKATDCAGAMQWLSDEGLLDHLEFPRTIKSGAPT